MFQVSRAFTSIATLLTYHPQRIRGAIDSTIAQEQARQRQAQASPSRSTSQAGKTDSRAVSPTKRIPRQGTRGRPDGILPAKGPDPADFESEFAFDDEDLGISKAATPQSNHDGGAKTMQESAPRHSSQEANEISTSAREPIALPDLPIDIRDKLRKLEKYESRYHGAFGIANRLRPLLTALRTA